MHANLLKDICEKEWWVFPQFEKWWTQEVQAGYGHFTSQEEYFINSFSQWISVKNLLCSWHYAMEKSLIFNFTLYHYRSNKRVIIIFLSSKQRTLLYRTNTKMYVIVAAAAKSFQSCPTLCDPIDGSPPGSPIPGILQARTLEWIAISFSNAWKWKVKGKSLSRVRLLATPCTAAYQAPPSMGFSRQEYWSGVPLPSPVCNGATTLIQMVEVNQ